MSPIPADLPTHARATPAVAARIRPAFACSTSSLASAVTVLALAAVGWPPHHAQAQTTEAPGPVHRVHLPILYAIAAGNGATATPNVPNPTPASPAPTQPDKANYANCDVRRTTDSDGDGDSDSVARWHNDARGQVTFYADDDGADGTDDWVSRSVYRADGEWLSSEHDEDGDGTVDTFERITWGGPGGRWIQSYETDEAGSSNDHVMRYGFTGRNMTLMRDTRSSGELFGWVKFVYDADTLVRLDADFSGDDVAESTIDIRWEGGLRIEERAVTRSPLGSFAQLYRYSYDASGRLIEDRFGASEDKWSRAARTSYGPDGFVARSEYWDLSKSPNELLTTTDYAYAGGRLMRIERREKGETTIHAYAYSCDGETDGTGGGRVSGLD